MTPYFVGAIGALGACIVTLWKITRSQDKDTKQRLTDCEEDRKDQRDVLEHLAVYMVTGDVRGFQRVIEHLEDWKNKKRFRPPSDPPRQVGQKAEPSS